MRGDEYLIKIEINGDVVKLLKKIGGVCRQMTTPASLYNSIDKAKKCYYNYKQ